jgi:glycosyltransferase involved in cell wall biosynthesis
MIEKLGLAHAVHFRGHCNVREALADHGIGVVLSMSDSARDFPCSESFHLAVADIFAAGGVGLIRHWEGAEYIWPDRFILHSEEAVVERILAYRDQNGLYSHDAEEGRKFVTAAYNPEKFVGSFERLFQQAI